MLIYSLIYAALHAQANHPANTLYLMHYLKISPYQQLFNMLKQKLCFLICAPELFIPNKAFIHGMLFY